MDKLLQNLRYSLQSLYKSPGLSLTVLLTLALGIGANTAIFTVDYATLLAPLPYPHPNQLVAVWSKFKGNRNVVSAGDFADWRAQATSFQALNAISGETMNVATHNEPEFIPGLRATPGYYRMLGSEFAFGRDFLPEEGHTGKDHVVILSHKFWQQLGGNTHVLGTSMRIDGEPYTVVGVLAPGIGDRGFAQVIAPLTFTPDQLNHDFHWLLVMGRLKPGVTIRQAQTDMDAVTARIAQTYPKSVMGWGAFVDPLKNEFLPDNRKATLWLLLGAVAFVLLIACVNVINLLLAKSTTRQKEIAIRGSLGATPRDIFAHLLTESLVLAAAGGILGIATGYAMLRTLIAVMPPFTLPAETDLRLNAPVLIFTVGAATLAGLVFGCAPAWFGSHVDPADSLKEGGRSGRGLGYRQLRRALVVGEFTLALALLAGAGLAIHSFLNLQHVDLGVRTDHVLTFYLPVPDTRPNDPADINAYYRRILASLRSVPGVSYAAASLGLPLNGMGLGTSFSIAGKPAYTDPSQRPGTGFQMVTSDYYQTYGIRIVKGRAFTDQDDASSVKVAVVNEEFVAKFLKGTDPLQQRVVVEGWVPGVTKRGPPVEWQIVGVFHNVRYAGLRQEYPELDVPFSQSPWPSAGIGVRTTMNPETMTKSITAAIHSVDPDIALANPKTLDQLRNDALANDRFTATLYLTFATIALVLATIGIYGVMAFSVTQRWHEMAVRAALGADRGQVVGLVVKEGAMLAAVGLGLGLVGAYLVGRVMRSTLFDVGALDVGAFGIVAFVLLAAALLASFVPAYHAASAEPLDALRAE